MLIVKNQKRESKTKRIRFFSSVFFLLAIVIVTVAVLLPQSTKVFADNEVTVSISPSFTEFSPGDNFTVNITIGSVVDLNAVQYDIIFDPSVLGLDDISDGMIDSTVMPVPTGEAAPQEITLGHWRVVQSLGLNSVNGTGYLSVLHFHSLQHGTSNIDLTDGILSGMTGEIPATWISGLAVSTLYVTPPTVTTLSIDKLGATVTTLNGKLDSPGTVTPVNVSFVWGTSPGDYPNETTPFTMSAPGAFSFRLVSLSSNTTYYFKAKAVGYGTVYGSEMSFKTMTSGCFIATAAYGSYLDKHLDTLRHFRDQYLITNSPGQDFVEFYYTNSPPVAQFIIDNSWLKPLVRITLAPVVVMAGVAIKITLVGELALIGFLVIAVIVIAVWMRKRRRHAAG